MKKTGGAQKKFPIIFNNDIMLRTLFPRGIVTFVVFFLIFISLKNIGKVSYDFKVENTSKNNNFILVNMEEITDIFTQCIEEDIALFLHHNHQKEKINMNLPLPRSEN